MSDPNIMKPLLTIFILIAISSCTQKTKLIETKASEPVVSIAEYTADEKDTTSLFYGDSTFYVGFVNYFPETKEYYTQLYFRADHPADFQLNHLLDSTIFSDMETGRDRLPMVEAERFLVIDGMEILSIYNNRHQLITTASLIRIEKLSSTIEDEFVAVYKGKEFISGINEPYYGVTEGYDGYELDDFSAELLENKKLNENIIQELAIDTTGLEIMHYKVLPENSIYSLLSTDKVCHITIWKGDSLAVLQSSYDDTIIMSIFPVALKVNDRPALLISAGVRNSDSMWEYLAVFKDSVYEGADRSRLVMK